MCSVGQINTSDAVPGALRQPSKNLFRFCGCTTEVPSAVEFTRQLFAIGAKNSCTESVNSTCSVHPHSVWKGSAKRAHTLVMGSTVTASDSYTNCARPTVAMIMIITIVESVDMDSTRVMPTRSADVLKSLNILDIRTKRTTRKTSIPGIFSWNT